MIVSKRPYRGFGDEAGSTAGSTGAGSTSGTSSGTTMEMPWGTIINALSNIISPKALPPIQVQPAQSDTTLLVVGGIAALAVVGGLVYFAVKA